MWPAGGLSDGMMGRVAAATKAGGPGLADLKTLAASMILSDPVLSERERQLAVVGRRLFFDPRLSADSHINCAHCHQPDLAFTDGLPLAFALDQTRRNTPTIVNSFASYWFFWDGRADSLAAQALGPLENSKEHGFSRSGVARVVQSFYKDEYETLFGPLPAALPAVLPEFAMPLATEPVLPEAVLSTAAASLTDPAMIRSLTGEGEPLAALARRLAADAPAPEAVKAAAAWEALAPAAQDAVNTVFANAAQAIAAWEKGLVANESPFDRFIARWTRAAQPDPVPFFSDDFTSEAFFGFQIFTGRGQCNVCHTGAALTDHQFHNIALPQRGTDIDTGRSTGLLKVLADPFNCRGGYIPPTVPPAESCLDLDYLNTETPEAIGSFKTPGLRTVAQTAPYMHDGRFATLDQVIDHYNRMDTTPAVGFREETLKPLGLDEIEKKALLAFLRALSSPVRELSAGQNLPAP
jgi:cytochrome c peroxidase